MREGRIFNKFIPKEKILFHTYSNYSILHIKVIYCKYIAHTQNCTKISTLSTTNDDTESTHRLRARIIKIPKDFPTRGS